MALSDIPRQIHNHAVERLHFRCEHGIVRLKHTNGEFQDIADGIHENNHFFLGFRGKGKLLILHFHERTGDADGMVGNPLKIAQTLQIQRHGLPVADGKLPAGADFQKIGFQHALIAVDIRLQLEHFIDGLLIKVLQERGRPHIGILRRRHHVRHDFAALLHGYGRIVQETGIQHFYIIINITYHRMFFIGITNGELRQFFKKTGERQEQARCKQVKHGMYDGNAVRRRRYIKERELKDGIQSVKQEHEYNRTDNVEIQMDERRPLCVFRCTDGRNQGCDTCTDILPHDDGHDRTIRHGARRTERLQDTYGSRGTLNDGREQQPDQHTEKRVRED